jgi:maleamate amidohydrolase
VLDPYQQIGYASGELGFGKNLAILAIDFQMAFTDPQYPLGNSPLIHRAVENTAKLLEIARRKEIAIASCYIAYHSQADMPYWKIKAIREQFFYGHPCTQMDDRIYEPSYDFNFSKSGASIFFKTPLITFLTKKQIDTVLIAGCTTSGCVRASAIDSFQYGYRTIAIEDCVGDVEAEPHHNNLCDIGRRYADVLSLEQVIDCLPVG